MPAGLADRPCIPAASTRPTRRPPDPGVLACATTPAARRGDAERETTIHMARHVNRYLLRVALSFRLLPVASSPTIRIRGLPRAVLPALGDEPPRMAARSQTPHVVVRRPSRRRPRWVDARPSTSHALPSPRRERCTRVRGAFHDECGFGLVSSSAGPRRRTYLDLAIKPTFRWVGERVDSGAPGVWMSRARPRGSMTSVHRCSTRAFRAIAR
jgi:hypothetical protein